MVPRIKPRSTKMAKSNKSAAPKSAAPKVTVAPVPAPKAATPAAPVVAATPAAPKPAAFAGFSHPVTDSQIQQFINTQCGGNPAMCGIVALENIQPGQLVPFLRKANGGRATIVNSLLWGFANGHNGPVPVAGAYQHFKSKGLAVQGYTDLRALLNGGFSASSKTWGQPFAKLVVLPSQVAPAK
jgi:hypothetical protein